MEGLGDHLPAAVRLQEREVVGEVARRDLALDLGESRFGPPDESTRKAIESLKDLDRLERLAKRLLTVSNWTELLAEH